MPIRIVAIKATGPVMSRSKVVDAMKRAVVNQQADGVRYMAEYPPQRPNSRYVRTLTLKRSWHMPPVQVQPNAISGEIASQGQIAPYNDKVQGLDQERFSGQRHTVAHHEHANFDDAVNARVEARGLKINNDIVPYHGLAP